MTQEAIALRTSGGAYPGLEVVQDVNKALDTIATDFAGASDPAALAGPFMTWADTGNMLLKRRNAAGTAWVTVGALLLAASDIPWYSQPIGFPIGLLDGLGGAPRPPTDNPHFRFIRLTASDAYNSGVLVSEAVSGSSPLITATAVISLASSPINGATINLINTEGRFLRASASNPFVADDAFQGHKFQLTSQRGTTAGGPGDSSISPGTSTTGNTYQTGSPIPDGFGTPRVANETRPRNMTVTYYLRVK